MPFALGIVTVLALLMTIGMGLVTWRLVREERRRSAARLAALAGELGQHPAPSPEPSTPPTDLFQARAEKPGELTRRLAGVGAAGVVIVAIVSVGLMPSTGRQTGIAPEASHLPIELLALTHDHQDGMLEISGTVRNPGNGLAAQQLTVMALVLDDEGDVVATERVPIGRDRLATGAESTFTVLLPAEVATRYRISFLSEDTPVPHLDRRTRPAGAPGHRGS